MPANLSGLATNPLARSRHWARTASLGIALAASLAAAAAACSEPAVLAGTADATAGGDAPANLDSLAADTATAVDLGPTSDTELKTDTDTTEAAGPGPFTCAVAGSGAGVVTFAAAQKGPHSVAVSGGYVYWTATNGLYRRSLAMGTIETLDEGLGSAGPLAIADGTVYFARPNIGKLFSVATTGGKALQMASTSTIAGLAVDATHVWFSVWLDNGMVAKVPRQGGAVEPFVDQLAFPVGIALGQDVIAWTTAGGDGKGTPGQLWYGNKQGQGLTALVASSPGAGPLVLEKGKVYWGEGGKVRTIAIDQTENQQLAGELGQVNGLAVSGAALVFTASTGVGGRVGRIATAPGSAVVWLSVHERLPRGIAISNGCVFWADAGHSPGDAAGAIRVRDLAAASPGTPGPCAGPDPAGCSGKPKDFCKPTAAGQVTTCAQNGPQDGCFPFNCSCDTATATWVCNPSCSGGICKPLCDTAKPTVHCCKDGQYAKPDCDNGVFSCPAGSLEKPFAGCGSYVGDKKAVVTCDQYPCKSGEWCCYSIVPNCTNGAMACYGKQACEGSHHCPAGQACCATNVNKNTYISTQCQPESACTGAPAWRACADSGDCPQGQNCCAKGAGGKFGLCTAGSCG